MGVLVVSIYAAAGAAAAVTLQSSSDAPSTCSAGGSLKLTFSPYQVQANKVDDYVCQPMAIPKDCVYHVTRFAPIERSVAVHHMILFGVIEEIKPNCTVGCFDMPGQTTILWAWAVGVAAMDLPPNVGLRVGRGTSVELATLQMHYNNPNQLTGIVDDSGVELTLTTELREHDMTTLLTGAPTNSILRIPPKQTRFAVRIEATLKLASTVKAFSTALHAHQVGNYVEAWLIRDGVVICSLGTEDPYNFNFQSFQPLPQEAELRVGDVVRLVCTYNTMSRDTCTYGGDGSQDEMCIHIMAVYPATGVAQTVVIESNFEEALSEPVAAWEALHPSQPWMWPQWVLDLRTANNETSPSPPPPLAPPTAPPSAALLDTSAAALASASSSVAIGAAPIFWSKIPSSQTEYSVAIGEKLSFQYKSGHSVVMMASYAAWQSCDFTGATELASSTQGGGSSELPNLYEAVTAADGTLYIACGFSGHCEGGQKVQVHIGSADGSGVAGAVMGGWSPEYQPVGTADYNPCMAV